MRTFTPAARTVADSLRVFETARTRYIRARVTDFLSEQLEQMAPQRAIVRAVECKWMSRLALERPVLDVGCGDGHFAEIAFRGRPLDVGLDPMTRDLAEAKTRRGVYRSLVRAGAAEMPFADGSFRSVISNSVLEHVPDLERALAEIARVLQPAGELAITVPSEHFGEFLLGSTVFRRLHLPSLAKAYERFLNRLSHHHHVDPPDVWRSRLAAVGIEVEEHFYYFSAAAHRRFDLSHYLGVPNLATKRLLGRWVLYRGQMTPFERWLRPWYEEPRAEVGAYLFFRGRKR
jgi:SAM-dependent methyltransferase